VKQAVRDHFRLSLAAGVAVLLAIALAGWNAASQAPVPGSLISASPAPNAQLAGAPDRIELEFSSPIDPQSATVHLLAAGGVEVGLRAVRHDPDQPRRIVATTQGRLVPGDYTVLWSGRAASDGALLAGAYPFRTGVVQNLGAAVIAGEWPAPWALLLRWLVFVGAALAAGGFAWARLMPSWSTAQRTTSITRNIVMIGGAFVALGATALPSLVREAVGLPEGRPAALSGEIGAMPLGWWLQLAALALLALLCLASIARGRLATGQESLLDWIGLGAGLVALAGLSLTSHAAAPFEISALALEIAHQWSSALWLSGVIYLAAGWRGLGTDIARFRAVRWVGGVLIAISVLTGAAGAVRTFPSALDALTNRYGQALAGKTAIVLAILALGVLGMVIPRRSNANRASGSLSTQGGLGLVAAAVAAVLALMAAPGTVSRATLAGVDLADVAPLDAAAFGADQGVVHLLSQPLAHGAQTLVVRLTRGDGTPLVANPPPEVQVTWTPMDGSGRPPLVADLAPDASGAVFSGSMMLPEGDWWQADVSVVPLQGMTSRAQFWLALPDPNVTGHGPIPATDPAAQVHFARGLESLTSLRSVRLTQRIGDGSGSLRRSRTAVRTGDDNQPAAFTETVIDAAGMTLTEETAVGDRRWILVREEGWKESETRANSTPEDWGAAYADATGFLLGPRQETDGETCQIVTFWRPSAGNSAWFVWWVGMASGEVRREVQITAGQYLVTGFSDFDAPLDIARPATFAPAPTLGASPVATPTR
jgi:copper transport protein